MCVLSCLALSVLCFSIASADTRYTPEWDSLDSRPLPAWYDEAKFGIFINWGLYSVPSFGSEWFWWYWQGPKKVQAYVDFMAKNYPPEFTYADFGALFTAEFYDPNQWVDILKASGARYVVFSSKHHEGFTTYPSKVSFNWNSMDVGPKRDLLGDLAVAIRANSTLRFGIYHSLFEWFNPLYLEDQKNDFETQYFVKTKTMPELYELVSKYKPEVIWSDGDWNAKDTYWDSKNFLAWLFNDSPVKDTVVTNDRWGAGDMCHHGSFYTCSDRYNPGQLQPHKWENCMTIDKGSWGYRRNARLSDYFDIKGLVEILAGTVSCGGNLLMNIAPTHDGRIVAVYEERLRQMGSWLQVNGEAIYGSKPWQHQNDTVTPRVWYTLSKAPGDPAVYAIMLDWPTAGSLTLGAVTTTMTTTVSMLGYRQPFQWSATGSQGIQIHIPPISFKAMPCDWAWVFKLQNLA